ncbi:hypothetical protein GCM10010429_08260 [Micromonospora olivasterospora]|uniref:Homeodomain-like domain-containing protein n=1 Tax=Micromonospora olivasterospora TaxID=1880 RepID=A0A562I991_MICOL|nr:Homeodomain-like domain-containing protein [Micromonospora olivasterospora]
MRPPHVYANLPDEQYHQIVDALHRQWRVATRAVMILLSAGGMPASEIGALLHYDPATVRRWIIRHDLEGLDGLPTGPAPGGLGWVVPVSVPASVPCLARRRRGPPPGSGGRWAAHR